MDALESDDRINDGGTEVVSSYQSHFTCVSNNMRGEQGSLQAAYIYPAQQHPLIRRNDDRRPGYSR